MKNIILGILVALILVLTYKTCTNSNNEKTVITQNSALIQEQLKNVGKLVVTEGHFSQVYTYKTNYRGIKTGFIPSEKKAIIIINAEVNVAYDLSKITYDIDEVNKIVTLTYIPEEEIKINPDFEYYDVQADYLNPFIAADYNKIKVEAKKAITEKINNSDLRKNAKNRLISELSKFYILTNTLGWTLKYNQTPVESREALEQLEPLKL